MGGLDAHGIHSPSRVFMLAGADVATGAALGISSGYQDVRRAAAGLGMAASMALPMMSAAEPLRFDSRPPLAASALSAQGRGGDTILQITVNGAPGQDPEALARAVGRELDRREREKRARVGSSLTDYD